MNAHAKAADRVDRRTEEARKYLDQMQFEFAQGNFAKANRLIDKASERLMRASEAIFDAERAISGR